MMVKATITDGSYGYRDPISGSRKYYGPGIDIPVPEGLAKTLGIPYEPLTEPDQPQESVPDDDGQEGAPDDDGQEAVPGPTLLPAGFPGLPMLIAAGYETVESVGGLNLAQIGAIEGISRSQAKNIARAIQELKS